MHYLQGRYPVLEKKILAKNMVQYVILCPESGCPAGAVRPHSSSRPYLTPPDFSLRH